MKTSFNYIAFFLLLLMVGCKATTAEKSTPSSSVNLKEPFRPTVHFTPQAKWMNDPNGMVYYKGEYHLFYQYYPDSTVWGPMHWGHAVSKDLVRWEHLPTALYPDSLGYIFSGSAVIDSKNSSGLKSGDEDVMVAIFTYHNPKDNVQSQGIAYSNDRGRSWTKYSKNPVLKNPGIPDFRDPKVLWVEKANKWIMTLAAGQQLEFYSSANLIDWKYESNFGKGVGAHGGVWECPDLFPMKVEGTDQIKWVLLSNINPGGPNGGSACQYFVGDFDGSKFVQDSRFNETQWLDYGRDHYAAVSWDNVPESDGRRLTIAWLNNWAYAEKLPTSSWRGGASLPRELKLKSEGDSYYLVSSIAAEFKTIRSTEISYAGLDIEGGNKIENIFSSEYNEAYELIIELETMNSDSVEIKLENSPSEYFSIVLKPTLNQISINRKQSGVVDFHPSFGDLIHAPLVKKNSYLLHIFVDRSSVEVFEGDGRVALTNLCYPSKVYQNIMFTSNNHCSIKYVKAFKLSLENGVTSK